MSPSPEKKISKVLIKDQQRSAGSNPGLPLQNATNHYHQPGKLSGHHGGFYGTYDSGSVVIGAASDAAIFKTLGSHNGLLHQGNLMFGGAAPSSGGLHFHPSATVTTNKTQQS